MKLLVILFAALMLAGCVAPMQDSSSKAKESQIESMAAATTTEFAKTAKGDAPQPVVGSVTATASGKGSKLELHFPAPATQPTLPHEETFTAGQKSNEKGSYNFSWFSSTEVKLPLGWALILIAVGIGALIFVYRWAKRTSPAFAALSDSFGGFVTSTNQKLMDLAHTIGNDAKTSTDPMKMAAANAAVAEVNRTRANIADSVPNVPEAPKKKP